MTETPSPIAPAPEGDIRPEPTPHETLPPNVAACLACVFPLIGGLILLNREKKNAFVRFWAMQSVYFGGATFVLYVVIQIISRVMTPIIAIPLIGTIIGMVFKLVWAIFALGWLAVYVMTIVQSILGKEWEIPYLGKLVRNQLAQRPS
jgi:uncharacterized membrane protein